LLVVVVAQLQIDAANLAQAPVNSGNQIDNSQLSWWRRELETGADGDALTTIGDRQSE